MFKSPSPAPVAAAVTLLGCLLWPAASAHADGGTLRLYLMAGQSNMVGHAWTHYEGMYGPFNPDKGNYNYALEYLADNPAFVAGLDPNVYTFKDHFEANWMQPRDDAWGIHIASSSGSTQVIKPYPRAQAAQWIQGIAPLSPGFGNDNNNVSKIGPELAFGHYLADQTTDPIFLFKSDTGGTTLAEDWRPPSAAANRPQNGATVGMHYTATVNRFLALLDDLDADLADDGLLNAYMNATAYQVAGLVWFQGFNEAVEAGGAFKPEYAANLVDFVHDIRAADARIPDDLFALIPESSDVNTDLNNGRQAAVAALNGEYPGSAAFFRNNDLINPAHNWGYHFNQTAENYLEIGWRMGQAAVGTLNSAQVVPEPTTALLLVMAGGLLQGRRRVQHRKMETP